MLISTTKRNQRVISFGGCALLIAMITYTLSSFLTGETRAIHTLIAWIPFILRGFALNVVMSLISMTLGTALGFALGLGQLSPRRGVRAISQFVMQIFRNTPWLVVLFATLYTIPFQITLPHFGTTQIPDWISATIGFSLPIMANIGDNLRGAIKSIPTAQWESSFGLNLSRWQTIRHIILPQCIKRMLPPWMNWYAILLMSTPIASIVGVKEALGNTMVAMESAGSDPSLLFPFYGFLLILFFMCIYPLAILTRWLEHKYAIRAN